MKKEIIGALLSGAAIIALSGCSSGVKETDIAEVKVTELELGRAVTFMEVLNGAGDAGSNEVVILEDPEPSEYFYEFCPTGQEVANVQVQGTPKSEGSYKRYTNDSSVPDQEGNFTIEDDDDIFLAYTGLSRTINTKGTGKLEVGTQYDIDCNDLDLQVRKIEIIECQAQD